MRITQLRPSSWQIQHPDRPTFVLPLLLGICTADSAELAAAEVLGLKWEDDVTLLDSITVLAV